MIYVTGDTHGHNSIFKLSRRNFPEGKCLTKKDYVIVLGDFGVIWNNVPDKEEEHIIKWLRDSPFTTLFIDGNHENIFRLNKLEEIQMFDSIVGKVDDSIYHLKRGCVYNIDGKSIFTFGGARSMDKIYRTEGITWWPEEIPSVAEENIGLLNLDKVKNKVDYILTHECPGFSQSYLMSKTRSRRFDIEQYSLNKYLDNLYNTIDFKKWFFGHWHINLSITNKVYCLYENIVELK